MAGAISGKAAGRRSLPTPDFLSSAVKPQAELSGRMLLVTFRERKVTPTEGESQKGIERLLRE
jgi:hypothetical protein